MEVPVEATYMSIRATINTNIRNAASVFNRPKGNCYEGAHYVDMYIYQANYAGVSFFVGHSNP